MMTPAQRREADRKAALIQTPEGQALLAAIRYAEGNPRANEMFSRRDRPIYFDSYSQHPGNIGDRFADQGPQSAAGWYQIQRDTAEDLNRQHGYSNFEPFTQQLMALDRLEYRGGLDAALRGDIPAFAAAASREWAGVPEGPNVNPQDPDLSHFRSPRWGRQHATPYAEFERAYREELRRRAHRRNQ
jgi:muramidase (phage lysozyme)